MVRIASYVFSTPKILAATFIGLGAVPTAAFSQNYGYDPLASAFTGVGAAEMRGGQNSIP